MIYSWRNKLKYPGDLVEWVASRPEATFYDIWDETIDPMWLTYLATAWATTTEILDHTVLAGCAVARLCLPLIPEGDERPRIAIETTEKYIRGEATEVQVIKARNGVWNAAPDSALTVSNAAAYAISYAVSSHISSHVSSTVYWALRAGIESQVLCATLRKHLVFELPPRPKGLTIWQRLAEGGDE